MMKKRIQTLLRAAVASLAASLAASLMLLGSAQAAAGGIEWDKFPDKRITDMAALQNGAKVFTNYCLNCHAAGFMRYNRLRDIGLTEQQRLVWWRAARPDFDRAITIGRRQGFGRRLHLHLPAHLLPRRDEGHRVEQCSVPERWHAPCVVGTAGPAAGGFCR